MDDVSPVGVATSLITALTTAVGFGARTLRKSASALEHLEARVVRLEERVTHVESRRVQHRESIEEIRELAETLQQALTSKLDSETFFVQLRQDQERWQQLSRSLGQIEGTLSVVNDKLRIRR